MSDSGGNPHLEGIISDFEGLSFLPFFSLPMILMLATSVRSLLFVNITTVYFVRLYVTFQFTQHVLWLWSQQAGGHVLAKSLWPIVCYRLYQAHTTNRNKHSTKCCRGGKPFAESTERKIVIMSVLRANMCPTRHTTSTTLSLLCLLNPCGAGTDSLCPPLPLPFSVTSLHTSFLFPLRSGWVPPAGLWPVVWDALGGSMSTLVFLTEDNKTRFRFQK